MSHRSEVLSQEQWDTITLLLPELMNHAPSWRSNRQLFEGILWPLRSVPVGQIYRTDTLVNVWASMTSLGRRRDVVTGVAHVDRSSRLIRVNRR